MHMQVRNDRLAGLHHQIADAAAFVAEIRAETLGSYDESEAREIVDALARCDAALARLKANP